MGINTYRNFYVWKVVGSDLIKPLCVCPRCNNKVNYILCFDCDRLWDIFKYNKIYAFKCPVCPNFEEISEELAKAIIKGGPNVCK